MAGLSRSAVANAGRNQSMPNEFDANVLDQQVRNALAHLYDLPYLQNHPLGSLLAPETTPRTPTRGRTLQRRLTDLIDRLIPAGPATANDTARVHRLLHLRYVEAISIEDVSTQLGIGHSEYYREHRRGLSAIVSLVREEIVDVARDKLEKTSASEPEVATNSCFPTPQLPVHLTSFVGRDSEVAEVASLLGRARLVTLMGPGGCGKTRLAVTVAETALHRYSGGACFVDLAPVTDPDQVPLALAAAIGVTNGRGSDLTAIVTDALQGADWLVVLDNCEHIVDACARLTETLLHRCPRLTVLATSRELLGIPGEQPWRVPSLPVPAVGATTIAEVIGTASVALFIERARVVRPCFEITDANASAVAEVCQRLDGMPLAIELAAARLRVLTIEQVAERLDDRFRLLTGGDRTALRRQQTLRATIDWSHDLLPPAERALLRRLAVFTGGCSLEAVEAICADDVLTTESVLDLLASLVDKSLVQAEHVDGAARYRLMETVRQYAAEKLVDAGEAAAMRDRHLDWFLDLAEQAAPELFRPGQISWLQCLDEEHNNLRAAQDWARASGRVAERIRFVAALGRFWELRGHALEASTRAREVATFASTCAANGVSPTARVLALAWTAFFISRAESPRGALPFFDTAVIAARALGEPATLARVLARAGRYRSESSAHRDRRRDLQHEAVAVARLADDPWATAYALFNLGASQNNGAEFVEARCSLEEALSVARIIGDRAVIANALEFLGVCAYHLGEFDRAELLLRESLAIWEQLGEPAGTARDMRNLGRVALARHDTRTAREFLGRSVILLERIGWRWFSANCLDNFAEAAALDGDSSGALRLAAAAAALRIRSGTEIPVGERYEFDRWFEPARQALGTEAADAAWEAGLAMTATDAIDFALRGVGT